MASPEERIDQLDELRGRLNKLVAQLGYEIEDITEQWQSLGNAGGQRADHASVLLGRLRPHLEGIEHFCDACCEDITGMIADPFERNAT